MVNLLFGNFSRYTILKDSRESWLYVHRFCCGLILFLILLSIDKYETGQGDNFFHTSAILFAFALTFSAITSFSSAVTEDKENQSLGLITLTNSSSKAYLRGRFFGRATHLISLLFILLPITLFSITLGGIASSQILQTFFILGSWLLLVSLISFWSSCLFSNSKESLLVAICLCSLIFLGMLIFQFSVIHRINEIMDFKGYADYILIDLLLYSAICFYLIKSISRNFDFAANNPISFWDEYTKKISVKRRKAKPTFKRSIAKRRVSDNPIMDKDKALINPTLGVLEYARLYPATAMIFSILLLIALPVFFLLMFLYIPFYFFSIWNNMTKIFELEFKEGTFSSLATLPYSKEKLLQEKFRYFQKIIQSLWLIYAIISITLLWLTTITQEFIQSLIYLSSACTFFFLPALFVFLKYLNLAVIFNAKRVDKLNLFFISMTAISLYFFIPVFLPIGLLIGIPYVKKLCYRKMDECIAFS